MYNLYYIIRKEVYKSNKGWTKRASIHVYGIILKNLAFQTKEFFRKGRFYFPKKREDFHIYHRTSKKD